MHESHLSVQTDVFCHDLDQICHLNDEQFLGFLGQALFVRSDSGITEQLCVFDGYFAVRLRD
jgi:hypothetical protein